VSASELLTLDFVIRDIDDGAVHVDANHSRNVSRSRTDGHPDSSEVQAAS
jgi:hypothetical protein